MADESRWREEDRFAMDPEERSRWNAWRDERDHGRYTREPWRSGPERGSPSGREFGSAYGRYGAEYGPGYPRGSSRDYPQGQSPRSGYERDYGPLYGGRGYRDGGDERGWWDRSTDEVAAWFGDEDAQRRRNMDAMDRGHRGRGPKGYMRSDERIREDVCDRLSDDSMVDASEVEVSVAKSEVTLSGTVGTREERRRAEDCAEHVSGVKHVQNNLRVANAGPGAGIGTSSTRSTGVTDNMNPGRAPH
jgi:osmotically-inducible protein OsmY